MIEVSSEVRPSMALELDLHAGQKAQAAPTPENLFQLIRSGPAWAVRRDGKLVAIGGHTPMWEGRTVVWGYLGADCGPALPVVTRYVLRELARLSVEFPRVEAYVERHHKAGHRWIRMLKFTKEGLMRKFTLGHDYMLYSRTS